MQFLPRLLSRRTTPRRQKICGNGLSLFLSRHRPGGNSATLSRTKRLRVASSSHKPRSLHRLAFFFFGRKPDQNPDVESIDSLAVAIYRVINLSGRIYLVENICNASLFDDRVDPRKRKRFFFLIWWLLGSNIESISDSFTGSIPLLRFIEAWLIHRKNLSSLTFMLIAGNARDFCRCVSLSFR